MSHKDNGEYGFNQENTNENTNDSLNMEQFKKTLQDNNQQYIINWIKSFPSYDECVQFLLSIEEKEEESSSININITPKTPLFTTNYERILNEKNRKIEQLQNELKELKQKIDDDIDDDLEVLNKQISDTKLIEKHINIELEHQLNANQPKFEFSASTTNQNQWSSSLSTTPNYKFVRTSDGFLTETSDIIQCMNKEKDTRKLDKKSIISCLKNNDCIKWEDFRNKYKTQTSMISLFKNHCNASTERVQKLWTQLNNKQNGSPSDPELMANSPFTMDHMEPIHDKLYISEQCTNDAIDNKYIYEHFESAKQFYHYLIWSIKCQQIDGFYRIFKSLHGTLQIIIYNVELHTFDGGNIIYIVGIRNDKKSPRWKHKQFMISTEVNKLGINSNDLPKGSRLFGIPFIRRNKLISGYIRSINIDSDLLLSEDIMYSLKSYYNPYSKDIANKIEKMDMNKYIKLGQIRTKQKKQQNRNHHHRQQLDITLQELYKYITTAINSNDNKYDMIATISFDKFKKKYFIDMVLPVKLRDNNWIGILYRDGMPNKILIDDDDICNKAILYNPLYNEIKNEWLKNNITRLRIEEDASMLGLNISANEYIPSSSILSRCLGRIDEE